MKPINFDVNSVIENLQGTCMNGIGDALDELYPGMNEEDLTSQDYDAIDQSLFECSSCGWWCETSESNTDPYSEDSDQYCDDCYEAKNEE